MRRPAIHLSALVLVVAMAAITHRVVGSAVQSGETPPRVASVDILSLLEDYLRLDEFKPDRDALRTEWESRLADTQQILTGLEAELRMATPQTPGVQQLQQRYQQTAYQFQQQQREASMAFDRFSAEQAADAYATLYESAVGLAQERGYSHLIASRQSGEIDDRNNLATVTQEILARPVMLAPEGHDLTAVLRDRLSIPEQTDEDAENAEVDGPMPADEGGDATEDAAGTDESDG